MERSGIQFVPATDGTPIACWSVGTGPPLVLIHNFVLSHAELEWEVPTLRSFYEALARHHQVIRLDPRTTGLTGGAQPENPADDLELLTRTVSDIESVVDAMGHTEFDLLAAVTMGAVGIHLAARGRVRRLILCDAATDIPGSDEFYRYLRSHEALAAMDPDHAARVMAHVWTDGMEPEDREPTTRLVEENASRRGAARPLTWDATPALGDVRIPTLLVYTRDGAVSMAQVHHAAATIPNAQLIGVEGFFAPYAVDREVLLRAFGEFLDWEPYDGETSAADLSVIVFTDIVASTEKLERLGDDVGRESLRAIEELVSRTAAIHHGTVVKHLGDGSLLEFASASSALDFAGVVQSQLADGDLGLRIGMAAGEPIREDGDVHGAVVVVASRIAAAAGSGETLVSEGVRQLAIGKKYEFTDQGEQSLKGFEERVRVWRLEI